MEWVNKTVDVNNLFRQSIKINLFHEIATPFQNQLAVTIGIVLLVIHARTV